MKTSSHKKIVCRGTGKKDPKKNIGYSLWLFVFIFLQFTSLIAQTNKQQYALNDPRNPDCPCHNYQKLAEEEYKRIRQNNNNNNEQLAITTENIKDDNDIDKQSHFLKNDFVFKQHIQKKTMLFSGKRSKRKRSNNIMLWMRRLYFHKHSKVKHFSPKYSICSKW